MTINYEKEIDKLNDIMIANHYKSVRNRIVDKLIAEIDRAESEEIKIRISSVLSNLR